MDNKKVLTITIVGPRLSGKSSVATFIHSVLKEHGIEASLYDPEPPEERTPEENEACLKSVAETVTVNLIVRKMPSME